MGESHQAIRERETRKKFLLLRQVALGSSSLRYQPPCSVLTQKELEKARILVGQVLRREKLKRDYVDVLRRHFELTAAPLKASWPGMCMVCLLPP